MPISLPVNRGDNAPIPIPLTINFDNPKKYSASISFRLKIRSVS